MPRRRGVRVAVDSKVPSAIKMKEEKKEEVVTTKKEVGTSETTDREGDSSSGTLEVASPTSLPPAATLTEKSKDRITITLDADIKVPVVIKNKFDSIAQIDFTPRLKTGVLKSKIVIGDISTPVQYVKATHDLAEQLVNMHDGIYVNVPDELIQMGDKGGKITARSAIGFDFRALIDKVMSSKIGDITLKTLSMFLPNSEIEDEQRNFCGFDFEAKLIQEFHAINQTQFHDIREWHSFFRYLEDERRFVAVIDPSLDRRFYRTWSDNRFHAYNHLVDNNRFLWNAMSDAIKGLIETNVLLSFSDERATVDKLARKINVRQFAPRDVDLIPSSIKAASGRNFFNNLLLVNFLQKQTVLHHVFSIRDFSATELFDALTYHLFLDDSEITEETRNSCDNYINNWLLPYIRGVNAKVLQRPMTDADAQTTNYLELNKGAIPSDLSPYLFSWRRGGIKVFNTINSPFINRTEYYMPLAGQQSTNWTDRPAQLVNFQNFVTGLQNRGLVHMTWAEQGLERAILALLGTISSSGERFSEHMYYSDRVMRTLMLSSLARTGERTEDPNRSLATTITIDSLGPASWFMLAEPSSYDTKDLGVNFIKFGLVTHYWFNKLVEGYFYAQDTMPSPTWKKSERIQKALQIAGDGSFKGLLEKKFGAVPNIHDVNWPSRDDFDYANSLWKRKIDLAHRCIQENKSLFGFTDHFYYYPSAVFSSRYDALWKSGFYYVIDALPPDVPNSTVNFLELYLKFVRQQYTEWARLGYRQDYVYRFDIPVKLDLINGDPERDNSPFNFTTAGQSQELKMQPLKVWYKWREAFLDELANQLAHTKPPEFVSDTVPVILNGEDFILTNFFHMIKTKREGWTNYDTIAFVSKQII